MSSLSAADDYNSEKEILLSFRSYIEEHPYLIHFNGSSFDLPYLKHRCRANGIEDFLSPLPNLDLCTTARSMKTGTFSENCRLKTIETKLGFCAEIASAGRTAFSYTQPICKAKFSDRRAVKSTVIYCSFIMKMI